MSKYRIYHKQLIEALEDRPVEELPIFRLANPGPAAYRAAEGRSLADQVAERGAAGAQLNNMAPAKSLTVLQQGIDTIILNIYGQLKEDFLICFEMAKEEAQAAEEEHSLSPLPAFDGTTPCIHASGIKGYEYRCSSPDVTVMVRRPSRSKRPAAVVRVAAQCLWRLGAEKAVRLAEAYLRPLFEPETYQVQVSRCDLATDFQRWQPATEEIITGMVKRSRRVKLRNVADDEDVEWYTAGRGLGGFAAGVSTYIRLNAYDKTRQIAEKGLEWVRSLWESREGYVPDARVWRLEYQFGREWLHEREIETVDQLLDSLVGMWAYGVQWFSVRQPTADSHRSRWPLLPQWAELSEWDMRVGIPLPKIAVVRPVLRRIEAGLWGYFTSFMAMVEKSDAQEAFAWFLQGIRSRRGELWMDDRLKAKQLQYSGFTMASG